MKICFAASSGGHFEQLMMLKTANGKIRKFCSNGENRL